jgi:hypothetical protein
VQEHHQDHADIIADIFQLIPPNERAAFREMLEHETCASTNFLMASCVALRSAHGARSCSTVGRQTSEEKVRDAFVNVADRWFVLANKECEHLAH